MGATLVSNNLTLAVTGAIAVSAATGSNLFSTSSGSYCLFNVAITTTGTAVNITIGGVIAITTPAAVGTYCYQGLVSGPGHVVAVTGSGGVAYASGVQLSNTP